MELSYSALQVTCPFCDYTVTLGRRSEIYRNHIPVVHPEEKEAIEAKERKLKEKRADLAARAKIQCFLCSFAGVKISNMARHYSDRHG